MECVGRLESRIFALDVWGRNCCGVGGDAPIDDSRTHSGFTRLKPFRCADAAFPATKWRQQAGVLSSHKQSSPPPLHGGLPPATAKILRLLTATSTTKATATSTATALLVQHKTVRSDYACGAGQ